mmetsp:Transcript_27366/g.30480  ORF Transcript_27366/g.30480 Transcript_27366/m.30480 type:complete len:444 (+) Transcript_27366:3-1334(+)
MMEVATPNELEFTYVYTWGAAEYTGHAKSYTDKTAEDVKQSGWYNSNTTRKELTAPLLLVPLEMKRITSIQCCNTFTLALSGYGDLYSWGTGMGTGFGEEAHVETPRHLEVPGEKFTFITVTTPGGYTAGHAVAITDTLKAFTWGKGCLAKQDIQKPTQIKTSTNRFTSGACGDESTILLTDTGIVLEIGVILQFQGGAVGTWLSKDTLVDVKSVAMASNWAAAVTNNGDLYLWGKFNSYSSANYFGIDRYRSGTTVPFVVPELKGQVDKVFLGWIHLSALTKNGDVYMWGEGDTYRQGHAKKYQNKHLNHPVKLEKLCGVDVESMTLSRGNEGCITKHGEVLVWGGSEHGGHHRCKEPTLINSVFNYEFAQNGKITHVSCGKNMTGLVTRTKMTLVSICVRFIAYNLEKFDAFTIPPRTKDLIRYFLEARGMYDSKAQQKLQ